MSDRLLKFMFRGAPVRGELVRVTDAWREMTAHHQYPAPVKRLLGEMVAAAALLASNIKFNGALVMQVHGDGPVKLLVVECQPDLSLARDGEIQRARDRGQRDDARTDQPQRARALRDHPRSARSGAGTAAVPGHRPARRRLDGRRARKLHAPVGAARDAARAGCRRGRQRRAPVAATARYRRNGRRHRRRCVGPRHDARRHAECRRTAATVAGESGAPPLQPGGARPFRRRSLRALPAVAHASASVACWCRSGARKSTRSSRNWPP